VYTFLTIFKDSFSKLFPDDLEMVDGNTGVSNNLKNTVVKKRKYFKRGR